MVTATSVYQTDDPNRSMMRRRLTLVCLLLLSASLSLLAQSALPEPHWASPEWSVRDALQAAGEIDLVAELKPLYQELRSGDDPGLRQRLERVKANEEWPLPARERLLHAFALGLGELPPGAAGPESLAFLMDYRPRVLVPHEDHVAVGVPLFNIAAAAAGSVNQWRRQTAYDASREILARGAEDWMAAYSEADPASRRGLMDALELASGEYLRELTGLALRDMRQRPELTLVAARSAALLSDPLLLGDALVAGGGPELAAALRLAATSLDEAERIGLLRRLVAEAPAPNGSLAIAELAPGLLNDPAVAGLLFDLLDQPTLGAAAALTLANSTEPAVRGRLVELAARGDDRPSRRAAVALEAARQAGAGNRR